ncbi:MAG: enoyl-CoA hydratase-related protein [Rhodothermus sp.]|nr:enoyl-CoA hydratase-related protein [Rhodothermus sp.]
MQEVVHEALLFEHDGPVAVLTLNRPERRNALNRTLEKALHTALLRVRDDESIRAVVLTGAGPDFCSGADLSAFQEIPSPAFVRRHLLQVYGPIVELMTTIEKPIIGAINGTAAGAGCALALACDLRVMADNASLMLAFSNIGLVPDMGATYLLVRQIGYARAFEMAAEGQRLPASRCLSWGLANRVVPAGRLQEEARRWARELAARPTLALGLSKAAFYYAFTATLREAVAFEALLQQQCIQSHDHQEGVRAFLEKRPPVFTGD